jgi:hypothetical protein
MAFCFYRDNLFEEVRYELNELQALHPYMFFDARYRANPQEAIPRNIYTLPSHPSTL